MKTYINEIKENADVDSFFLVNEKTSGVTKTGNIYFKLKLSDRSGEMEGRIWTFAEKLASSFEREDFVHLKGKAALFQERLQLNIASIEKVPEAAILFSDFFPMTENDPDHMFQTLLEISRQVKNQHLSRLLGLFWEDEPFVQKFKMAPASTRLHHTYLGGLLEHTLSVARLVLEIACHYDGLNLDLLLAGSILHDLGKVDELSYHRAFDYSDEGRLIGHIILGIERVQAKIDLLPDFPRDLSTLLKHLLLSHHGQYIWGSPKRPMTLEAVVLHYLDDMDAKINGIKQFLKTQVSEGSRWSAYHREFDQFFYVPDYQDNMQEIDNIKQNGPKEQ